ncbi:MAG: SMP-30/gluconolactonase/LRE family protein [Sphingomicrobium sp.]
MKTHHALAAALLLSLTGAAPETTMIQGSQIVRTSSELDRLIDPKASFRKLGGGMQWSEGPVWISEGNYVLLSDVPGNRIHKWSEADGFAVFMDPSGGNGPASPGFREPGTNGLKPGGPGEILAADHGSRAVVAINLSTKAKRTLASHFNGKRFNSPNDVVVASDGAIWFTDPPYGLEGINDSPLKEQPANGVYRLAPDGTITLVVSDLTFPNGIGLSPDGKTLYVAVSDPKHAVIMAYDVVGASVTRPRLFADMTALVGDKMPGLPDGLTVDQHGNLFATGPGGVHVIASSGKELGRISTGKATANVAFGGPDGHTLFLTSSDMLVAVPTKTRAAPAHRPALFAAGERG